MVRWGNYLEISTPPECYLVSIQPLTISEQPKGPTNTKKPRAAEGTRSHDQANLSTSSIFTSLLDSRKKIDPVNRGEYPSITGPESSDSSLESHSIGRGVGISATSGRADASTRSPRSDDLGASVCSLGLGHLGDTTRGRHMVGKGGQFMQGDYDYQACKINKVRKLSGTQGNL
ncbi:hypothetical protein Cgig2_021904 [Carnegiea gigantea]|uniref:Uncharacterized protein n=1 Tax=Carnegiea gigantea TaxID=171969 RepID=A0A9Q1JWX0_9CARY|nr:hypothetical protein Cgig2_021904 [Carnegiea gigantea]